MMLTAAMMIAPSMRTAAPITRYTHFGGPLFDGNGSKTGAADENAVKAGRSSLPEPRLPGDPPNPLPGAPRVEAAMARMSISPEPSVLVVVLGGRIAAAPPGDASDCRLESENSTEFSLR